MNSSESPGRKNPISRPDSAKITPKMPKRPTVSISFSGSRKPPAANTGVSIWPRVVDGPARPGHPGGLAQAAGLRLVPLGPAHAAAAGPGVGEAAQRPGEAGRGVPRRRRAGPGRTPPARPRAAGRPPRRCRTPAARARPSVGREPVCATSARRPPGGCTYPGWYGQRVVAEAHGGAVEAGAVVEPAGGPRPAERPPVAHAPRVVALADGVELRGRSSRPPPGSRRAPGTAPRSGSCRAGRRRRRRRCPSRGRGRRAPARRGDRRTSRPGRRARGRTPRSRGSCGRTAPRPCGRPTGPRRAARASRRPGRATVWSTTVTSGRPSPTRQAQYQAAPWLG